MNLYLVRHGESEGNRLSRHQTAEEPLSKKGKKQAKLVAERFVDIPIDIIYSSPMHRARETAKLIAKKINKEVELWEPIHELLRPSVMHGKSSNDSESRRIDELLKDKFLDPEWRHSDEENFTDLNIRAESVLSHLLEHHKDQNVLCVSHGTFTKAIVCRALFGDKLTPEIFVSIRYHMWAANTGITHIEHTDKHGWALMTWNDVTHL